MKQRALGGGPSATRGEWHNPQRAFVIAALDSAISLGRISAGRPSLAYIATVTMRLPFRAQ